VAGIISDLILRISEDHAQFTKGLGDVKNQIGSVTKSIEQIGSFIKGAFALSAVVGFGTKLYELAGQFDDIADQLDSLNQTFDQTLNVGRVKAIADTMNVDLNAVLVAANSASKNFGISMNEALQLTQQGLSIAGPKSEKFLKALTDQADKFATAGGDARQYFALVSGGFQSASDWERQIALGAKATTESFDTLVGRMTDGQKQQQALINSTAAFNSELASLFGNSIDAIDSLKISAYDLATKALRAVKSSVVDIINYFIELYNESLAFRAVVQGIIISFKTMWEVVKGLVSTLINGFSSFGKIVKAIFTGDFSAIPDIIKNALVENTKIFSEAGQNIYDAFKTGFENAAHATPIKLIDESSVLAPTTATNGISSSAKGGGTTTSTVDTSNNALTAIKLSRTAAESFAAAQQAIAAGITKQKTMWQDLGTTIQQSLGGVAVDSINALGTALGNMIAGQKADWKSLLSIVLGAIAKIISGLIAQAIASQVAANAKYGLIGVALAGVAIASTLALIHAKTPKFAAGTDFAPGGLALVGERGAELVNLPRGSQVIPNKQTQALLSGGGKIEIGVSQIKVRGEDLYLVLEETKRRRGI
jgi:hypothetical protein